jgi:hypothetical protein
MSPWLVLGIAWVVCCAIFLECAYRAPLMEILDGWLVKQRPRKPGRHFPPGIVDLEDYRYRRRGHRHSLVRPAVPVREATARKLEPAE